jgi:periplasmic protein TonB
MTSIRLPVAFVLAVVVTGLLFWFLWALIHAATEIGELKTATRIEFTRLRRDTEVQTKREEKARRERPTQTPNAPQMSRVSVGPATESVQMLTPTVDVRGALQRISVNVGGSDRDVIPLVRIEPEYPNRAANRGVEGWVLVQFTITPAGTVKDATAIDAHPKGYFEDAALKAIARWRYNPKVEGGVAVERRGIQVVLRFQLEN